MPIKPPAQIERSIASRLEEAIGALSRHLRHHVDLDLPVTLQVGLATIERAQPVSLGDLARYERTSPATMTRIVGQLAGHGLVVRVADQIDGRIGRVSLTDLGQDVLNRIRAERSAWVDHHVRRIEPVQEAQLRVCAEVLEALAASGAAAEEQRNEQQRAAGRPRPWRDWLEDGGSVDDTRH